MMHGGKNIKKKKREREREKKLVGLNFSFSLCQCHLLNNLPVIKLFVTK